jgi:hypothetical protein
MLAAEQQGTRDQGNKGTREQGAEYGLGVATVSGREDDEKQKTAMSNGFMGLSPQSAVNCALFLRFVLPDDRR